MAKTISDSNLKLLVSQKLRQLRTQSQKTIEETANDLDLDITQYMRLLKGTRLPRLSTLLNINTLYGLNMDWWFAEIANNRKDKINVKEKSLEFELLNSFRKLDLNHKETVVGMIHNLFKNKQRIKKYTARRNFSKS
jgi:transcriptional regulator with XRE-family HTH domain